MRAHSFFGAVDWQALYQCSSAPGRFCSSEAQKKRWGRCGGEKNRGHFIEVFVFCGSCFYKGFEMCTLRSRMALLGDVLVHFLF